MIKNYFKIALRNLWKNKGYSFLNISGLAIGITCAGLIFLWIEGELNYDQHIEDKHLVYSIPTNQKYDGEWRTFNQATPGPLAQVLKDEIPEVEKSGRMRNADLLLTAGETALNGNSAYADQDIFEIFSMKFIAGNAGRTFQNKKSIVLTQDLAERLFQNEDPLNQTLLINKTESYQVTGIIQNIPESSTYTFNSFIPFENFTDGKDWTQGYDSNFTDAFVKLKPSADYNTTNEKVKTILPAKTGDSSTEAILFSAEDWHLRNTFKNGEIEGGQIEFVRLFAAIALIILIIACINFMNIATAQSEKRANEVGMRKALGSSKNQLIFQFLSESMVTAILAGALSVGLLLVIIPEFNALLNARVSLRLLDPLHIVVLSSIILICGLLAGLYPAFYLSSFKPVSVLKGAFKAQGGAITVRKGLVVAQFSVSIIFIISTILVYQQVLHVKNRDLGIEKDNLVEIPYTDQIIENFELIEQDLKSAGVISSAGLSNSQALSGGNNTSGLEWDGKPKDEDILVSFRTITKDYFKTTGLNILEGRGFSADEAMDSTSILISRSFADLMKKEDVIGSIVTWGDMQLIVKGVVANYQYGDMYKDSDPVLFYNQKEGANYLYLKPIEGIDTNSAITKIEKVLDKHNEGYPFEYRFVDDAFETRFRSENLIGKLSQIFAVLAIFISCLGLFGLSAYTAEQRRKEIGVRKVLGSSVANIVKLLSQDFLKLIGIAVVIAIPLGYLIMENWLQDFAYRIEINPFIFLFASMSALAIALLTVSFQAIKAAIANPIRSLKTD